MKKILITGGPVHAYLDAVKIITNRFKGGLMVELANEFLDKYPDEVQVTYLTSKLIPPPGCRQGMTLITHDGFDSYKDLIKAYAQNHDAVILGAAVANLIPANPIVGKFPSHNYKIGDVIPINFTIAPRIINMVKQFAPKTHVFGYKLLSGVPHEELVRAAYEILLDSHATAVFANDAKSLHTKYAITKERSEHLMDNKGIAKFVWECIHDNYYKTELSQRISINTRNETAEFMQIRDQFLNKFRTTPEGYVFGTIAIRGFINGFLTTTRGKKELNSITYVTDVDHVNRTVHAVQNKPTLNAPLLDWIFKRNRNVHRIIHWHEQVSGIPTFPYAPPGTVRDTQREIITSFNIFNHGCFMLYDVRGNRI